MFHQIYLIIEQCERSINGNVKVGLGVSSDKIVFTARWSEGYVLREQISMIDYVQSKVSDEVYVLSFIAKANKGYTEKTLERRLNEQKSVSTE